MINAIIKFFMKKNVQKIVIGAIVVAAGLIMLKKYMDAKKQNKTEEPKEEKKQIAPISAEPALPVPIVKAEVSIENDPVKDLGQSPMPMPDDTQYALV